MPLETLVALLVLGGVLVSHKTLLTKVKNSSQLCKESACLVFQGRNISVKQISEEELEQMAEIEAKVFLGDSGRLVFSPLLYAVGKGGRGTVNSLVCLSMCVQPLYGKGSNLFFC